MTVQHLSSRYVYENPWMKLRVDQVRMPDGSDSEYGIVERASFVLILPVRGTEVLMVCQHRYPINAWTWEFPQGACEPGESIEQAARRELLEETGYPATDLRVMNKLYEAAAFATHSFHVVIAWIGPDVQPTSIPQRDAGEAAMVSQWISMDTLRAMVAQGDIQDAPSMAALLVYQVVQ